MIYILLTSGSGGELLYTTIHCSIDTKQSPCHSLPLENNTKLGDLAISQDQPLPLHAYTLTHTTHYTATDTHTLEGWTNMVRTILEQYDLYRRPKKQSMVPK